MNSNEYKEIDKRSRKLVLSINITNFPYYIAILLYQSCAQLTQAVSQFTHHELFYIKCLLFRWKQSIVRHPPMFCQAFQKYIDWDNDIGCEYFPSDGVCLTTTDAYVCPATAFFGVIKERQRHSGQSLCRLCSE